MEHTEAEIDSVISRQNVSKEGWTTYYVDGTDGNDGNNFLRWETAAKTIQAAIDKAESWCKIYVKARTYVENVIINKEGLKLIGEKEDNVIIQPTTGDAITIDAYFCNVDSISAKVSDDNSSCIVILGIKNHISNCVCSCPLVLVNTNGVLISGDDTVICNNVIEGNLKNGIVFSGDRNDIHDNLLDGLCSDGIWITNGRYSKVYQNDIFNCSSRGIIFSGAPSSNSVFHNNLIANSVQAYDVGGDNKFFENFYDDHIVDTNNDGLCDTPYTFVTGIDYTPVSKRNGWLQVSLGMTSSSSIIIANTFSLVNALLMLTETGGTLTTDGTVQNLYINNAPAGVFDPKAVQIDFTNQTATETVVIRESYRIKSGGGYIEKDAVTFAGVQSPLLKNINLEPNRFGVKVTIEKTGGANRDYDYEVIYKI